MHKAVTRCIEAKKAIEGIEGNWSIVRCVFDIYNFPFQNTYAFLEQ